MRRSIATAFMAGCLVIGSTASAGAATPALMPLEYWGWVNVKTQAAGTYTPAAANRGNSQGLANTVNHESVGYYTLTMNGLGLDGGNVQVTVVGDLASFCSVASWGPSGADEQILVQCFDASSNPADARFTVQYVNTNHESHRFAYLFADQFIDDYDTTDVFSYNSAGNPNHVRHVDTGVYEVTLPGLGVAKGDVQVTPFWITAAASASEPARVKTTDCKVSGWGPDATGGQNITVLCFEPIGDPYDTPFTLIFTERDGLKGPAAGAVAYLWADSPTSASYHPVRRYRFSSASMVPTITRQGPGKYTVVLPGMPEGGTVKVTAYGVDDARCTIKKIRAHGTPQKVQVRCWSPALAGDSRFTLSYEE